MYEKGKKLSKSKLSAKIGQKLSICAYDYTEREMKREAERGREREREREREKERQREG